MNDEDYWIDGYKILMHGTSVKQKMGHSRNGVCIILSPKFAKAYEEAGKKDYYQSRRRIWRKIHGD